MSSLIFAAQRIPNSLDELQPIAPPKRTHLTTATRAINSTKDFSSGPVVFQFNVPQNQVLKPRQSYWRLRAAIGLNIGANQPLQQQQEAYVGVVVDEEKFTKAINYDVLGGKESSLALAYNAPATLMKSFTVRLNDKVLSTTDEVAHIDTLCKRLMPRELQKTVTPHLEPNYYARHKTISMPPADEQEEEALLQLDMMPHQDPGVPGSRVIEMVWQPSFGAWDQESLPPGDYQIHMKQESVETINKSFVQSLHDEDKQQEYQVDILGFDLYYTLEETPLETVAGTTFVLDMVEHGLQQQPIPNYGDTALTWNVGPSLCGLAVAFQSNKSYGAQAPRYSKTIFTAPDASEPGKDWIYPGDNAARLRTFQMKVNKQSYPEERYELLEDADAGFPYSQMYFDNLVQTGAILSRSEAEGLDAFTQLGPYMYFDVSLSGAVPPIDTKFSFVPLAGGAAAWKDLDVQALLFRRHRVVKVISYDAAGRVMDVKGSDE